jgi:MarR family transcriptional regulator, organic hydroperoxide resistance regulator
MVMSSSSNSKSALAKQVWKIMFDYLMKTAPERNQLLGERGLTPNDSRALFSLDIQEGRTMRSLAEAWTCDASNATWIVDRLEKMGFAERKSVPQDRRIKLVVLTKKGVEMKSALLEALHTPPEELLELDRKSLESLLQALKGLPSKAQ